MDHSTALTAFDVGGMDQTVASPLCELPGHALTNNAGRAAFDRVIAACDDALRQDGLDRDARGVLAGVRRGLCACRRHQPGGEARMPMPRWVDPPSRWLGDALPRGREPELMEAGTLANVARGFAFDKRTTRTLGMAIGLLYQQGFYWPEQVTFATDAEILAAPGVGPTMLDAVRRVCGGPEPWPMLDEDGPEGE